MLRSMVNKEELASGMEMRRRPDRAPPDPPKPVKPVTNEKAEISACSKNKPKTLEITTTNKANLFTTASSIRSEILQATIPTSPPSSPLPDLTRPYRGLFPTDEYDDDEQAVEHEPDADHTDDNDYDDDDFNINSQEASDTNRRIGKEINSILLSEHQEDNSNQSLTESMHSAGQNDTLYSLAAALSPGNASIDLTSTPYSSQTKLIDLTNDTDTDTNKRKAAASLPQSVENSPSKNTKKKPKTDPQDNIQKPKKAGLRGKAKEVFGIFKMQNDPQPTTPISDIFSEEQDQETNGKDYEKSKQTKNKQIMDQAIPQATEDNTNTNRKDHDNISLNNVTDKFQEIVEQMEKNNAELNNKNKQWIQEMKGELGKYTNTLAKVKAIEKKVLQIETHVANQLENNQENEGKCASNEIAIRTNMHSNVTTNNNLDRKVDAIKNTIQLSLTSTNETIENNEKTNRENQTTNSHLINTMRSALHNNDERINLFNSKVLNIEKDLNATMLKASNNSNNISMSKDIIKIIDDTNTANKASIIEIRQNITSIIAEQTTMRQTLVNLNTANINLPMTNTTPTDTYATQMQASNLQDQINANRDRITIFDQKLKSLTDQIDKRDEELMRQQRITEDQQNNKIKDLNEKWDRIRQGLSEAEETIKKDRDTAAKIGLDLKHTNLVTIPGMQLRNPGILNPYNARINEDLRKSSEYNLRERIRDSNGKLTLNLNRLKNQNHIRNGENFLHQLTNCFVNGSINRANLPITIIISSSQTTKFANLKFGTRKTAKDFLADIRSKWDFDRGPMLISHFKVLEEHAKLHSLIVSHLRETLDTIQTRFVILQNYLFVPRNDDQDGNPTGFLSNYAGHPISLYTIRDTPKRQRKYYMNGHFEEETTTDYMGQIMQSSKFTPENNHVDKITDVTLQIFQSYGMESEEIAQERGWIAYTIPQERGINQDQQQQQYQQQQDRQQQNGPQQHEQQDRMDTDSQNGRGRGQPRGAARGRGQADRGRGSGANRGGNRFGRGAHFIEREDYSSYA